MARRGSCAGCAKQITITRTSTAIPYCRECRRAGLAPRKHGAGAYKAGCRCAVCLEYNRIRMRRYVIVVRDRDGISPTQKARGGKPRKPCPDCGKSIRDRKDSETCGECGARRRRRQYGRGVSNEARLAVYERDGWLCQLCGTPTDPEADSNSAAYPTVDHIEPQSSVLIPDHTVANLRTAHRGCNSRRGVGQVAA